MSTEQTSSCVSCRRRKVKCDRLQPCSNCSKAQVICVPSVSLPPCRRKGQPLSEDELHRRLRRYETLLKSYAARIAKLEGQGNTHGTGVVSANPESSFSVHNLWLSLSDDILEEVSTESEDFPVQGLSTDSPETIPEDIKLGLSVGLYSSTESLAYLHPPPVQIFKLWQIFLDNVHPLTKIIHAPTLQPRILENSLDVTQTPRALEALMFALYFCAVTSLEGKDCESEFNETRNALRSRFHGTTMAALMRANLFNTSDVVLLQAAILFMVAISGSCDPGELWVILGTVVRIAQRLRLPEKAISSTIPVLDAEISRRICWQISLLDARGAEIFGMGNSGIIKSGLTSLPLNVNDNDICKNTTTQPRGQSGATEMIFLLLKYEGANFVRESEAMAPYGGSWVTLSSPTVPIEEKNSVINVLECLLEEKYLRYCDPTIPIHQLGLIRTRLVLNRMRLTTRHPRRRLASESQISPEEKSEFVNLCLEILADDNLLHTTPELKKYLWHVSCHSHIDAIVYLLGELRESRIPEWEDIAWLRITSVFEHHPEMISYPHDRLTKALSILALQSWDIKEQRANSASHPPAFITRLRQQFVSDTYHSSAEGSRVDRSPPVCEDEGTVNIPVSDLIQNSSDSSFMPEYPATDGLAAIDWDYWNSLLGEASNGV